MLPHMGPDLPRASLGSEFRKLWAGQTVSLLGTEVTFLALPLTAILLLDATPAQMGVLGALTLTPHFLVSLFAGVWVDRARRRPFLIASDLGRALLLGSIPLAALLGALSIWHLYAVGFLVGVLNVFFGVAYQSYLPSLVGRDRLAEANGRLAMSAEATAAAGPGIGGVLVGLLTAPVAILLDALSYLGSALFVTRIRPWDSSWTIFVAKGSRTRGLRLVDLPPSCYQKSFFPDSCHLGTHYQQHGLHWTSCNECYQ